MNKDSVIVIEDGKIEYEGFRGRGRGNKCEYEMLDGGGRGGWENWSNLLLVSPLELPLRIGTAFVPPVLGSRKVYVDLVGPLLAVSLLAMTLHLGHASKELPTSPSSALLLYLLTAPCAVLFGARLGRSRLSHLQVLALLGYSLYGPLFTLITSLILPHFFFFPALFLFGGSTAFRVALVLLLTIPRPVARLLLCSLVGISHILFTIFTHFAYMHETFVYGSSSR